MAKKRAQNVGSAQDQAIVLNICRKTGQKILRYHAARVIKVMTSAEFSSKSDEDKMKLGVQCLKDCVADLRGREGDLNEFGVNVLEDRSLQLLGIKLPESPTVQATE